MSLPSYTQALDLSTSLGPEITIITEEKFFEEDDDVQKLDIGAINAELAKVSGSDGIIFEKPDPPKDDIPFRTFVAEQRALTHH